MIKVLVGCPTFSGKDYCLDEYVARVKSLTFPNYDILLVDNSKDESYCDKIRSFGLDCIHSEYFTGVKKRIANSRNLLRQKVLDEGYDFFLSLEQDIIPPVDVIQRLILHQKRVVTGIYTRKVEAIVNGKNLGVKNVPVVYTANADCSVRPFLPREVNNVGLKRMWMSGLGCLLIHRSILEKIEFKVDNPSDGCDDMFFFNDLQKLRIMAFADTSVFCKHLEKKWSDDVKKS